MKVTFVLIVVDVLRKMPKGLETYQRNNPDHSIHSTIKINYNT